MSDDSSVRIASHLRSVAAERGPGAKLPSTRELAARFGAGPVTVQRALARLVAEGVVETRSGAGTYVRRAPRATVSGDLSWQTAALGPARSGPSAVGSTMRSVPHDTIALHGGYPDTTLLPMREIASAFTRLTRGGGRPEAFARPPTAGLPDLRRWFVDDLDADDWRDSDALITSGGQAALVATFGALARPGEAIVMESPTYWGAIAAARQAGLVIVPVPRTGGAPSAADLDAAFASSGARLAYVQPNFANPTGDVWTAAQREAVLDVVRAHRTFLVEDDWAHDFAMDITPRPLVCDDTDGHVIYIRSLTKSLSPTVRVAGVLARGPARARIGTALTVSDLYVSPVLQAVALDVVARPAWRSHLHRLARALQGRRDALVSALAVGAPMIEVPAVPRGGLNLWAALPANTADGTPTDPGLVAARALALGVAISPGPEWFPTEPTGPFIRLNFAAAGPERYDEAVAILAAAVDPV
ncbi:PLP-dependent aminotransferase family protein [Gordonia desulfuricans]|uniref:PLP-dependent aminotransferase family protein n=1 Tax=Gordonia desulfuricans TaxID=89051 RepID=A0A7K3LT19_9ACTN|nr:PLP-dependent aminotransferase family protein [Gordonia desulfuricans]NDK91408.1 PLP-dependent aminotransferase family protein [Gordonia desulfuricans]